MSADSDRTKKNLVLFIRKVLGCFIISSVDYLGAFPCKVISQNTDESLELLPDDARVGSLSGVPIRYGIPGVSVRVAGGGRALLQFAMGDPTKPYCTIWESASVITTNFTSTTINIGVGANTGIVRFTDLKAVLDSQVHLGNLGYPTGSPVVPLPANVGSSVGKVAP